MSRPSILMILGILVMITPFSGLPVSIRTLLFVLLGGAIFGLALSLRTADHTVPR